MTRNTPDVTHSSPLDPTYAGCCTPEIPAESGVSTTGGEGPDRSEDVGQMQCYSGAAVPGRVAVVIAKARPAQHPDHDLRWLQILAEGLGHEPLLLELRRSGAVVGRLPLAFVRSLLFGRFLVSLPYLNSGGVQTADPDAATLLIDEAVRQAEARNCSYLAMRHEQAWHHPALTAEITSKVHMRLQLPDTSDQLWNGLKSAVRNQVRKGQKQNLNVQWGRHELLKDFYAVFSRNMRDLGTPAYAERLFSRILHHFEHQAELCTVSLGTRCVAAALLVHGAGITAVPSASSLRKYNRTNANMLMYWHLLERAVQRGQHTFDFGRSTREGSVYRFKMQWGAEPHPAVWQFHLRHGSLEATRPESDRNQRLIRLWRRLPVGLTRLVGPAIVRGLP